MVTKPTKPTNSLPSSFGGDKENFSASKIQNGYEPDVPDILGGANLNYVLDTLGKKETYYDAIVDFINNIPIAKTISVDANNNLVYRDWLGGRNYGELVYSAIPLSDSGLKLLDGSLIDGNGIYANFVTYIASIYSTYPSIFVTEATWQSNVSTYGVCGKFVYDSVNNTVRLPKITGIVEGTVDVNALGDVVQSGLPQHTHSGTTNSGDKAHTHTRGTMNITGSFRLGDNNDSNYWGRCWATSGAFGGTKQSHIFGNYDDGSTETAIGNVTFNASSSWTGSTSSTSIAHTHTFTSGNANNSVYKTSVNTVQPQTVKCFVYMVVATGITKTNIEIDIDDVIADLNYKADIDLSNATENISTSAKAFFAGLSFPSNNNINLPLGAAGDSYTAPANGWFVCQGYGNGNGSSFMGLYGKVSTMVVPYNNTADFRGYIPVTKNEVIQCYYNNIENAVLTFVYAQSEV